MLCPFHIIVSSRQKFGNNTLDIITNISGFRKRSGIRNSKGHIQQFRKCLYQISFTTSGRSDHQHIRLCNLHTIFTVVGRKNSLIMIIHSDRYYFFGMFLTNHIFIQAGFNLMWRRNILHRKTFFRFLCFLFLFHSLLPGNLVWQRGKINHTDVRHIVHQIIIIDITVIHSIKTFLHTIRTDMNILRKCNHRSCFAFRSPAQKADFFKFIFLIIYRRILTGFQIYFIIFHYIFVI